MQIPALHSVVSNVLSSLTDTTSIVPNTATPAAVSKGGTGGLSIVNTFYEFGYKQTEGPNSYTVNLYSRTGQDSYQQVTNSGTIAVRTFDIPGLVLNNDRTVVYNDANYAVFEYLPVAVGTEIWIWTYERLRSDPTNTVTARICFLRSLDGLTGRVFAAPVVQTLPNVGQITFHSVIKGAADGSIKYLILGYGSPAGLRRCNINLSTGELTNLTLVATKSSLSEGGEINIDNSGTIISLSRVDSGGYLQQSVSTDWGLTFSTPVDSLVGASTSPKPTPCVVMTANRPGNLTVSFNDRGAGNRDKLVTFTSKSNALALSYQTSVFIGTPATQGNSGLRVVDGRLGLYLYVCAKENGEPVGTTTTTLLYWVMKDQYVTNFVEPAPWR